MCVALLRVAFSVEPMWEPRGPLAEPTEDAMPGGGHDGGGGSGAARRRRERRLRQHRRHEQLTLRMLLATYQHHAAPRGQTTARSGGRARDELHGEAPDEAPPQAAGAQYFRMDDDEEAPAAWRPAPLMEVQPQARLGRHGGIGFELVLSFAVPQGVWEAETALHAFLKGEKEKEEAKEQEKKKALTRKVTVQAVPEVHGGASSRAAPLQERLGGGKMPRVIPPRRISERIHEQIVDVPGLNNPQKQNFKRIEEQIVEVPRSHGIPQERISEHIEEQNVDDSVPQVIPQKRISKHIVEQNVDDSVPQVIPQKRISKRNVEQNVDEFLRLFPQARISKRLVEQNADEPGLHGIPQEQISERIEGRIGGNPSTSSTAAATLNSAKWLGDGDFRTFSSAAKSAKSTRQSSANLVSHSSSWPPAAYQEEEAGYDHFDFENMAWRRRKFGSEFYHWFLHDGRWHGPITKAPWDL